MPQDDEQLTPVPDTPLWPLKGVEISGLFGSSEPLMIDLDSGGTILTGQNGSGKSTVMRAIHLASLGRFTEVAQLPISKLTLMFGAQSEEKFSVTSKKLSIGSSTRDHPQVTVKNASGNTWKVAAPDDESPAANHARMRAMRARSRAEHEHFLQLSEELREPVGDDAPDWVKYFRKNFKTAFVSTRRLEMELQAMREEQDFRARGSRSFDDEQGSRLLKVDNLAEDIRETVRRQLAKYATESTSLEKGLPAKIVEAMAAGNGNEGNDLSLEVATLKDDVDKLAKALADVGILPDEEDHLPPTNTQDQHVLLAIREVYKERKERLGTLTVFSKRLELFLNFVGDRFSGKRVELDPDVGIAVVLSNNERIELGKLSSGEQQLLVLAHQLLFDTAPYSVVLIDEPELSLHVSWLRELMAAFLDIGESSHLQFLVATHSPSVVAGFRDKERSLDALSP